jgi:hypothetical protein
MSLFANGNYRWRETYFVLFERAKLPSPRDMKQALGELGAGYEITDESLAEDGCLEALTVISVDDFAAMDISLVTGEEVDEQIAQLQAESSGWELTEPEQAKLERLPQCNARFDIYHFQRVVDNGSEDEEEELMDPGSLLAVLDRLTQLCDGIGVDPQAGLFM